MYPIEKRQIKSRLSTIGKGNLRATKENYGSQIKWSLLEKGKLNRGYWKREPESHKREKNC